MPAKANRSSVVTSFRPLWVALPPTPTNTGTGRRFRATVRSTRRSISNSSSVGCSPVVPSGEQAVDAQPDIVPDQAVVALVMTAPSPERRDERQTKGQ